MAVNVTSHRFEAAVDAFDSVLHKVPSDGWAAATPCSDWDTRTLVNHVVGECLWVVPLMDGKTIADVGAALDGDVLGDDPVEAWHRASTSAQASIAVIGALDRTVHLSYGDERAGSYADQVSFDLLIHSWDLARAAGAYDRMPDGMVAWALGWIGPMLEAYESAGMFAARLDVPADASPQTRLLALTGRAG